MTNNELSVLKKKEILVTGGCGFIGSEIVKQLSGFSMAEADLLRRAIGKKETEELAVMIDTFRPLMITEAALKIDDGKYYQSWLEPDMVPHNGKG